MIFDQINGTLTPSTGAQALFQLTGFSTPRAVFVNPWTSEIWVGDNASAVRKYPIFQDLLSNSASTANVQVPSAALALAQDQYGDLIVADATNRVGFYFPAADAVNGGNFLPSCVDGPAASCRPLAPGILASICSQGSLCSPGSTLSLFGPTTAAVSGAESSFPLPTILGDMRVDMSWTNADGSTTTDSTPLYYVSATQINFVVPMSAPATGTANLAVVQNSTGRIYAAGQVWMAAVSPAILMLEYTGTLRQGAVVNLADGTVNSTTNAAARGTSVIIYATGQGFVPGAPADGAWNSAAVSAPAALRVNIAGLYLDQMAYDVELGHPAEPMAGVLGAVVVSRIVADQHLHSTRSSARQADPAAHYGRRRSQYRTRHLRDVHQREVGRTARTGLSTPPGASGGRARA